MRYNQTFGALPHTAQLNIQKIIKGTPEQGFPAVCALSQDGTQMGIFCTGALIAPSVVLTAAHCVVSAGGESKFKVMFLKEGTQNEFVVYDVDEVFTPRCNIKKFTSAQTSIHSFEEFDVALVFLKSPVPSTIAKPLPLDFRKLKRTDEIKIVGFGNYKTEQDALDELASTTDINRLTADQVQTHIDQIMLGDGLIKRSANISCEQNKALLECEVNTQGQIQYKGDSGGPILKIGYPSRTLSVCGVNSYVATESKVDSDLIAKVVKCFVCPIPENAYFIHSCFKIMKVPSSDYYTAIGMDKPIAYYKALTVELLKNYTQDRSGSAVLPVALGGKAVLVADPDIDTKTKMSDASSLSKKSNTKVLVVLGCGVLCAVALAMMLNRKK